MTENMPERLPSDDEPPFAAPSIPAEPAELEAWKERYTDEIVDHFPGGIGAPWRR